MIPNKQIGWSQKANLLWEISRQLDITLNAMRIQVISITSTTTTSSSTTTTTTTTSVPEACMETPVTIGTQTWAKCNLNVSTFRNGDVIPQVTDPAVWASLTTPAWCYLNNDPANGPIYGKLYNGYAVNDPRGLAPVGQHIPTNAEWTILSTFLGGESVAGGKLKEIGSTYWDAPNTNATNESGFSARGGAFRVDSTGAFFGAHYLGLFWTSTPSTYRLMSSFSPILETYSGVANTYGFSVRCLID
jgi:uncharacterized protein (TIGR02145 family)